MSHAHPQTISYKNITTSKNTPKLAQPTLSILHPSTPHLRHRPTLFFKKKYHSDCHHYHHSRCYHCNPTNKNTCHHDHLHHPRSYISHAILTYIFNKYNAITLHSPYTHLPADVGETLTIGTLGVPPTITTKAKRSDHNLAILKHRHNNNKCNDNYDNNHNNKDDNNDNDNSNNYYYYKYSFCYIHLKKIYFLPPFLKEVAFNATILSPNLQDSIFQ